MQKKTKYLVQAAAIAALYALLTLAVQPLSSGLIQLRVSEALCVLPFFTAAAVPGLFVGCVVANLLVGAALPDVIFGSLATLIAAQLTRFVAQRGMSRYLAPLPAVAVNAVVVGVLLYEVYDVGAPLLACMGYVAAGQALACYGLGLPLMAVLKRYRHLF